MPSAEAAGSGGRVLQFEYPELPPTENHVRQIRWIRHGGKAKAAGMCYTPEADSYMNRFADYVRQQFMVDIQKFRRGHDHGCVYSLTLVFFFPREDILNKGWLLKGKKRAKTPHKKMDVGNRRKLLEDCLSSAIDIDDSLFFSVDLHKVVSEGERKVLLILEEADPRMYSIPEEYWRTH